MAMEKIAAQPQIPESRDLEAGVEGFGQAATLGFLPQLQAGASKVVDFLTPESEADKKLKEQGFTIEDKPETFIEARDKFIKRKEGLQEESPISFGAGQLAGGVSTGIAGASLLKGGAALTAAGRAAQAVKAGAIGGVLRNPGDTEGELSGLQLGERAENALSSGAISGVFQGAGEGVKQIAKAVRRIPKKLKVIEDSTLLRAIGTDKKAARRIFGQNKVKGVLQTIKEKNIVEAGDNIEAIAKKAASEFKKSGKAVGSTLKAIDDDIIKHIDSGNATPLQLKLLKKTDINLDEFATRWQNEMKRRLKGLSGSDKVIKQVSKELDQIKVNGKVSLKRLQEVRNTIEDQIKFNKANQQFSGVEKEFKKIRNAMQDLAKKRIKRADKVLGTKHIDSFKKANREFSNLSEIQDITSEKVLSKQANRALGLSEQIGTGVGATVGTLIGGPVGTVIGVVGGGAAAKAAKDLGAPVVARTVGRTVKILEKNPKLLGEFLQPLIEAGTKSPKEFALAVQVMMANPKFKRKVRNGNR